MSLLTLIIWIIVLGAAVYFAYKTGIPPLFKTLIYILCAVVAVYLVLDALGLLAALRAAKVPRV